MKLLISLHRDFDSIRKVSYARMPVSESDGDLMFVEKTNTFLILIEMIMYISLYANLFVTLVGIDGFSSSSMESGHLRPFLFFGGIAFIFIA